MPDKPTSHDALIAKMDALVGRHRAEPANDPDEIPVLTQIVGKAVVKTNVDLASETIGAATPPKPQEKAGAGAPDLNALIEAQVVATLKQELGDQWQPQVQVQIALAIRETMEQESEQLARRIAARVSELLRLT